MEGCAGGRSLPVVFMLVAVLAVAAYFVGWEIPVAAAAVAAIITAGCLVNDTITHNRRCPECRAARAHFVREHPEWLSWTDARSHRADLSEAAVVAVFYQDPDHPAKPAPYKLFAVEYGSGAVSEIDRSRFIQYHIKGYG